MALKTQKNAPSIDRVESTLEKPSSSELICKYKFFFHVIN